MCQQQMLRDTIENVIDERRNLEAELDRVDAVLRQHGIHENCGHKGVLALVQLLRGGTPETSGQSGAPAVD